MNGFTFCTEKRPLLLIVNAGEVEPCRCGRVFRVGGIDYWHGPERLSAEAIQDHITRAFERLGLTSPPG